MSPDRLPKVEASRDSHPQCSADGRRVAFARWLGGPEQWWATIDGDTPRPLVTSGETAGLRHYGFAGSFSPDGERVAFFHWTKNIATSELSTRRIAIASSDGEILARLPHDERVLPGISEESHRVQWSPDGRALYYSLQWKNESTIWKRAATGGPLERVECFEGRGLGDFESSADGARLACTRSRSLSDAVLITGFHQP